MALEQERRVGRQVALLRASREPAWDRARAQAGVLGLALELVQPRVGPGAFAPP